MRIKTPLGLFTTIVGVGLVPAFGIGGLLGVSLKDYSPPPTVGTSVDADSNIGNRVTPHTYPVPTVRTQSPRTGTPGTGTTGRVEFVKPTQHQVKPTTVKVYKTPHDVRSTVDEPTEESPNSVPETPAPTYVAPEHTKPNPVQTREPDKPTTGPEDSDLRPTSKNS